MKTTKIYLRVIIILIYLANYGNAFAQTEQKNLEKYWNYRDRQRKWFLKIGSGAGHSLPAFVKNSNGCVYNNETEQLHFGDVGAYLGDYLATLATEYRLLKDANQDVVPTLNEIYYALNAIHRLDDDADGYFAFNNIKVRNGFFMRDDVRADFNKNWLDIYPNTVNQLDNVQCVISDYFRYSPPGTNNTVKFPGNEESQDQLIGLILGLTHIVQLVDNEYVKPLPADIGFNIVSEARAITSDLMSYVTSEKSFNLLTANNISFYAPVSLFGIVSGFLLNQSVNISFANTNWTLTNPVTNKMVGSGGGWLQPFSYPLSKAAKRITCQNWDNPLKMSIDFGAIVSSPTVSLPLDGLPRAFWNGLGSTPFANVASVNFPLIEINPVLGLLANIVNTDLTFELSDVFNKDYNRNMALSLAVASNTWSPQQVYNKSMETNMYIFDLMNAVLNNTTPLLSQSFYQNLLNQAPCNGPNSYSGQTYWYSTNKWAHPAGQNFPGEYNGNDYMWLYNLYQLAFKTISTLPMYKNNACQCFNSPSMNSTVLLTPQTIVSRFPSYEGINVPIPEFLTHNYSVSQSGHLNLQSDLTICNNANLQLLNDGLNVGDPSFTNDPKSVLTVRNGSKLWILNNGIAKVNSNSKIVIEPFGELKVGSGADLIIEDNAEVNLGPGSSLILEPGATIELRGPNAKFISQGVMNALTLNSGQQLNVIKGTANIGGIIELNAGSIEMLTGSTIKNIGCKVYLNDVTLSYKHDAKFILGDENSLINVKKPCDINIGAGKSLIVLNVSSSIGGTLKLNSGSFIINTGGKVKNDNCKILLNEYAIHYYKDAEINLNGSEANLQLGNNIYLHHGADLHFNGNGYFSFKLAQNWIDYRNLFGDATNTITISGSGANDKIIDVIGGTWVHPSEEIRKFIIRDGLVSFGDHSLITIGQPYELSGLQVNGTSSMTGDGFWVGAQADHLVKNNVFTNLEYGLRAYLNWGDGFSSLRIDSCSFIKCGTGLKVIDRGIQMSNNFFDYCLTGLDAEAIATPSRISNSTFEDNDNAVKFSTSGQGSLYINDSRITDCGEWGIDFSGTSLLNLKCNYLYDNTGTLKLNQDASLNVSPLISGFLAGNNIMHAAAGQFAMSDYPHTYYCGIKCNMANQLYLEKGHNDFSVQERLYQPNLDYNYTFYGNVNSNCSSFIHANNNKWFPNNLWDPNASYPPGSQIWSGFTNYNLRETPNSQCIAPNSVLFIDVNPVGTGECIPTDDNNGERAGPLEYCPDCPVIKTEHFQSVKLNEAVVESINKMELCNEHATDASDLTASDMLSEILIESFHYKSASVDWLSNLAYSKLKEAIGNAVQEKKIADVKSSNSYINKLITIQSHLLENARALDNDIDEFYLTIDLAATYRLVNDLETAIDVLQSLSPCMKIYEEEQIKFYNKWMNELVAEQMLKNREITIEQFDDYLSENTSKAFRDIKGSFANIDSIRCDTIAFAYSHVASSVIDDEGNKYEISTENVSSTDYVLTKTNNSGVQWTRTFDGINNAVDSALAIAIDMNNFIYVTGKSWNGYNFNIATIKYDAEGNHYWTAIYDDVTFGNDEPISMEVDSAFHIKIKVVSYNDTLHLYKTIYYSQCDSNCIAGMRKNIHVKQDSSNDLAFQLKPNPAHKEFCISIAGDDMDGENDFQLTVYNMLGEVLLNKDVVTGTNVSIEGLPQGIYDVVLFKKKTLQTASKRLIVE